MRSKDFSSLRSLGFFLLLLSAVLAASFQQRFSSGFVMFSSDGPLGYIASMWGWALESFNGFWPCLNWVGRGQPAAAPSITMMLCVLLGAVGLFVGYIYIG